MEEVDNRFELLVVHTQRVSEIVDSQIPVELMKTPRQLDNGFIDNGDETKKKKRAKSIKTFLTPDLMEKRKRGKHESSESETDSIDVAIQFQGEIKHLPKTKSKVRTMKSRS